MARVVLVTVHGGGHFNTGMLFAKQLAARGVFVTILLPWIDKKLGMSTEMNERIEMRALSEYVPSLPSFVFAGVRNYSSPLFPRSDTSPLENALREQLNALTPNAVVLDRIVAFWARSPVDDRGIRKYILYTTASAHLAVVLGFHGPGRQGPDENAKSVIRVPGLPPLRWAELPLEVTVQAHTMYLGKEGVANHFVNSDGILLNTSEELEGPVLKALIDEYPEIRFIPIGPLYPSAYLQGDQLQAADYKKTAVSIPTPGNEEAADLLPWMDEQPPASLVFICFGSFVRLCEKMIRELAAGLESSGYRFIWSIRNCSNEESRDAFLERMLPPNFLEQTSSRGRVLTGWVPQQLILSHPSLGAFLSHCGWSSAIECMILAGVPLLAWPILGDQPQVCRHLVDEYRIAVDIGVDGVPSAERVRQALEAVMEDETMRERAKERRKLARQAALATGPGSSAHNLANFVNSLF